MRRVTSRILACVGIALFVGLFSFAVRMALREIRAGRVVAAEVEQSAQLAIRKIELDANCKTQAGGTVAVWDITLRNTSDSAFKDIRYRAAYATESGTPLRTHDGTFTIILKPYETRRFPSFNDGFVPRDTARCSMHVTGAADWGN